MYLLSIISEAIMPHVFFIFMVSDNAKKTLSGLISFFLKPINIYKYVFCPVYL